MNRVGISKLLACAIVILVIICLGVLIFKNRTLTVKYIIDGKEYEISTNLKKGDVLVAPSEPTKEGYDFLGWYVGDVKFDFEKPLKKSEVLEAKYKIKEFIVTIDTHVNAVKKTYKVKYGEKIEVPSTPSMNGYTFIGWYSEEAEYDFDSIVIKDTTIEAKWKKNRVYVAPVKEEVKPTNYTVAVLADNGISNITGTGSYEIGSNATLSVTLKEGYSFVGWSNGSNELATNVIVDSDKTLEVKTEKITYKVTYDLDGGIATNPTIYDVESDNIHLSKPIKIGYVFTGWTGSNGDMPEADVTIEKGSTKDKIYVANWALDKYTVVYKSNTDVEYTIVDDTFVYGIAKTLAAPFTREGYKFVGWNLDNTTNEVTYQNGIEMVMPSRNEDNEVILYAVWSPISYKVKFVANTDSYTGVMEDVTVQYDQRLEIENGFNKEYYIVKSFDDASGDITIKINDNGKYEIVNLAAIDGAEVTLYAKWELEEYTITYDLGGGIAVNPTKYTYKTPTFALINPIKTGYTFKGWIKGSQNLGLDVSIVEGSSGDIDFKAAYEANKYTVTLDSQDDEVIILTPTIEVEYDSNYPALPVLSKEGYVFKGWYKSIESTEEITAETVVNTANDHTLYARWEAETVSPENIFVSVSKFFSKLFSKIFGIN